MDKANGIDIKLLRYLLLFLFTLSISMNRYLIPEIHPIFYYLKIISKLPFAILFLLINRHVFSRYHVSLRAVNCFHAFVLVCIVSIITVNRNLDTYPSLFAVAVLIDLSFIFYITYFSFDDNRVLTIDKGTDGKKVVRQFLLAFGCFLVFMLVFEIAIKYLPQFSSLFTYLRLTSKITFPYRLTGFFLDPNRWSLFLLFISVVFLFVYNRLEIRKDILFYLFYSLIGIYLIAALSKTAFFIIPFLLLVYFPLKDLLRPRILAGLCFIGYIAHQFYSYIAFSGSAAGLNRRLAATFENLQQPLQAGTFSERVDTYIAAFHYIANNFFSGAGYLNFYANTFRQYDITVHNTFLAMFTYFGIWALPFYIIVFIYPIFLVVKRAEHRRAVLSFLVVFFIYSNILSIAHDMVNLITFYLCLVIFNIFNSTPLEKKYGQNLAAINSEMASNKMFL